MVSWHFHKHNSRTDLIMKWFKQPVREVLLQKKNNKKKLWLPSKSVRKESVVRCEFNSGTTQMHFPEQKNKVGWRVRKREPLITSRFTRVPTQWHGDRESWQSRNLLSCHKHKGAYRTGRVPSANKPSRLSITPPSVTRKTNSLLRRK